MVCDKGCRPVGRMGQLQPPCASDGLMYKCQLSGQRLASVNQMCGESNLAAKRGKISRDGMSLESGKERLMLGCRLGSMILGAAQLGKIRT